MSEAVPSPASARRSRRRRKSSGLKKLWIALGVVALLVCGLAFAVDIWLTSYLQSDKFRLWMSGEMSRRLEAEVNIESIRWQDSTATVSKVTATGGPAAVFSRLEALDVRAMINAGAILDRVWQVDEVKVARLFADLSATTATPSGAAGQGSTAAEGGGSSGFLSSFLPNRTQVKGVMVDQAGFTWKGAEHSAEGRGISLRVKPSEGHEFYLASGSGGTLETTLLRDTKISLDQVEASLQGDEIKLEDFRAEAAGADLTAEGTVTLGETPALDLSGTVNNLDLARVEPESWLKSVHGKISGDIKVTGDPRSFSKLAWSGHAQVRDGLLEGLPLLAVIARKTQNEGFMRLVLKEARAAFSVASDGAWLVDKLTLDAPGLLRLKGYASCAANRSLYGELLLGIVPGTLRYLAGAEQEVFLPLDKLVVTQRERALITPDDAGLLWTRLKLRGTLENPQEDLADRLAKAWFNATVDEVMNMSMEGAVKAATAASKLAGAAAGQVIEQAPDILNNGLKTGTDILQKGVESGGGLLKEGVEGGLKTIEGLLPK